VPTKHPRIDRTTTECQKLFASEAPDPGRHHVGTPGDIISECPGDFVGIRSDGFSLHRLLTAHGITNYVLEPTSILINRRARRAKTDRLDAIGMLRVLAAYLRGDRQSCSMVRVPTPEEEDAKRIHRERENLVHERLRIENRIECCSPKAFGKGPLFVYGSAISLTCAPVTDARCRAILGLN
jgi:Transposase